MAVDIKTQGVNIQKSINQMVDIIKLLDKNERNKIPQNVQDFFINNYSADVDYNKIQAGIPLKEQKMEEYTVQVLTYITDKYLRN